MQDDRRAKWQACAKHQIPHQLLLYGLQELVVLPGRILGSTVCRHGKLAASSLERTWYRQVVDPLLNRLCHPECIISQVTKYVCLLVSLQML